MSTRIKVTCSSGKIFHIKKLFDMPQVLIDNIENAKTEEDKIRLLIGTCKTGILDPQEYVSYDFLNKKDQLDVAKTWYDYSIKYSKMKEEPDIVY